MTVEIYAQSTLWSVNPESGRCQVISCGGIDELPKRPPAEDPADYIKADAILRRHLNLKE